MAMNKESILRMADVFARKALVERGIGYNQGYWHRRNFRNREDLDYTGHKCGTVGCIAGWTIAELAPEVWNGVVEGRVSNREIMDSAKALLGLNTEQTVQLFGGSSNPDYADEEYATCTIAATLKHLAETGTVDWQYGAKKAREDSNGK